MKLHVALGDSTPVASEMGAAFAKALDLAESLGDSDYQLRALQGLYAYHAGSSRYRAALPFAQSSMISQCVGRTRAIGYSVSAS